MMSTETQDVVRYSDAELAAFENLINEKLVKAREQLRFYQEQISDLGESDDAKFKSLGESTTSTDTERLFDLASRQEKLIHHLENAKLRIKNKVYGICRETNKLISKERLMAVPHATLSIAAKQRKWLNFALFLGEPSCDDEFGVFKDEINLLFEEVKNKAFEEITHLDPNSTWCTPLGSKSEDICKDDP